MTTTNERTQLVRFRHPMPARAPLYARELSDPSNVVAVFALAKVQVAEVTRDGWKFLWNEYGLDGLLAIARQAEWFDALIANDDERAAETLVRQSLADGYDPVSGLFGDYSEQNATFEMTV